MALKGLEGSTVRRINPALRRATLTDNSETRSQGGTTIGHFTCSSHIG